VIGVFSDGENDADIRAFGRTQNGLRLGIGRSVSVAFGHRRYPAARQLDRAVAVGGKVDRQRLDRGQIYADA
jgi:hypothetical protein